MGGERESGGCVCVYRALVALYVRKERSQRNGRGQWLSAIISAFSPACTVLLGSIGKEPKERKGAMAVSYYFCFFSGLHSTAWEYGLV
jgi:hypothetical protein